MTTDICALHDYMAEKELMKQHFADRKTVEATFCDQCPTYAKTEPPPEKKPLW